jgi:short-subunit dehydrogenase
MVKSLTRETEKLEKSYTVITGGLGGLGSAFALECAKAGRHIILIDLHPAGGDFLSYLREHYPVDAIYYQCDLAIPDQRDLLFEKFDQENYSFSGLINIAGLEIEGQFMALSHEQITKLLQLNVECLVDLTYAVINQRDENQRFMLINVASLAGYFPMPYKALYAASKRFMINFSIGLREEIKHFGNVTVLCPAGLPTTAESMKKIFIQGFWGRITAQDTDIVVRKTFKKVQRNVPIYIPGFPNAIMGMFARLLPESLLARYLANRWEKRLKQLSLWRMVERQRSQKV